MPFTRAIAPALAALLAATPAFAPAAFAQPPSSDAHPSNDMQPPGGENTSTAAPPPLTNSVPDQSGTTPGTSTPAPMSSAPAPASPGAISGAFKPLVPASGNIIAELQASGEFTTLLKALAATNLTTLVQSQPNLTLLAPTDAAFAALPAGQLTTLMQPANAAQLQAMLSYHLINARVSLDKIKDHAAGPVPTVAPGKSVTIDGSGSTVKINDANVLQAAVPATNGLIYVVDKVLTPAS